MKSIALIAAAALIATPALANKGRSAATTPDATAASSQSATPNGEKAPQKTCRTYQTSGTHMKPERLCLTKEEWRKFDDNQ